MQDILRFMIVDDDPVSNFLTKTVISKTNLNAAVVAIENAETALECLLDISQELPNVILLDLNMPIMSGWEFIEAFSKSDYLMQASITLIILSASNNQRDIERAKTYGFVRDYINKPLTVPILENQFNSNYSGSKPG